MLVRTSRRTTDLSGKRLLPSHVCPSNNGESEALGWQDFLADFCHGLLLPLLARFPKATEGPLTFLSRFLVVPPLNPGDMSTWTSQCELYLEYGCMQVQL